MPRKAEAATAKKGRSMKAGVRSVSPPAPLLPAITAWIEQHRSNPGAAALDEMLAVRAVISAEICRRAHNELARMFQEDVVAHINDEYSPGRIEILRLERLTGDRDPWLDFGWLSAADVPYEIHFVKAKMFFGISDMKTLRATAERTYELLKLIDLCGGFRERIYRQMIVFGPGYAYEDGVRPVNTGYAEFV